MMTLSLGITMLLFAGRQFSPLFVISCENCTLDTTALSMKHLEVYDAFNNGHFVKPKLVTSEHNKHALYQDNTWNQALVHNPWLLVCQTLGG